MKYLFLVLPVLCFANCRPRTESVAGYIIDPSIEYINYVKKSGLFELPVIGASGYPAVSLPVYETASENAGIIITLTAGQGFTILNEIDNWWQIEVDNILGWVIKKYCTGAGLTPLASEWWHFNDLETTTWAIEIDITGEFFMEKTYSRPPLVK